ncbi:pEP153R [African swine fever virus]|uniref:Lectin-like protein EP153R n=1 Tax=African swine fever virus TaxID=10497 RepID=A0A858FLQ3_ASF|nr:pEP153R [African swine fever virus]
MYFKKKYIGLIDKNCEKKILDDCTTIKICYILIGILIGTNMITLIYNFIFWENYIKCYRNNDKMFYCPNDWVGYNNVCYYFSNGSFSKNYTAASNSCKQLNSTLANNDTNLLNLTKIYNNQSMYWVNNSIILRGDNKYSQKVNYTDLLFICGK